MALHCKDLSTALEVTDLCHLEEQSDERSFNLAFSILNLAFKIVRVSEPASSPRRYNLLQKVIFLALAKKRIYNKNIYAKKFII